MAKKHPATKFVGVKMPAALTHKIEQIARGESNTVSSVIRRLLTAAVQHEEQHKGGVSSPEAA